MTRGHRGSGCGTRRWWPRTSDCSPSGAGSPRPPQRAGSVPAAGLVPVRAAQPASPPGRNLPGPISAAAPRPRLRGPDLIPAQPPLGGRETPAPPGGMGMGLRVRGSREWGAKGMERLGTERRKDGKAGNAVSGGWRAQGWSRENGEPRNDVHGGWRDWEWSHGDGEPKDGVQGGWRGGEWVHNGWTD